MLTQQNTASIAVIKINFMDPTKKADRIAECQSKAYNRTYRDQSIGAPVEIHDGLNLTVGFSDNGVKDVTSHLVGADATVRFSVEQWESMNARFHNMDAIGAYVEVEVDGNVEYGDLVVNGEEVQSLTIYVSKVNAIEPMTIARVGSKAAEEDFFSNLGRDKARKAATTEQIRKTNRQTRAAKEGVESTQPSARKTAKV